MLKFLRIYKEKVEYHVIQFYVYTVHYLVNTSMYHPSYVIQPNVLNKPVRH